MDNFIQLLNNRARFIAKGCSKLVNRIRSWSKAKRINNNQIIFYSIYLLDIAKVNYFCRHSETDLQHPTENH